MNDLLYNYGYDVFSDNGEDGINEEIFKYLNITEGVVLEISAWDGFQSSNCANLWSKNKKFKGILVESTSRLNLSLEDTQKKLDKALKRNLEKSQQNLEKKAPTNPQPSEGAEEPENLENVSEEE